MKNNHKKLKKNGFQISYQSLLGFLSNKKNTKQVNLMFYFQNLKNTNANDTKRFLKKLLLELEFSWQIFFLRVIMN